MGLEFWNRLNGERRLVDVLFVSVIGDRLRRSRVHSDNPTQLSEFLSRWLFKRIQTGDEGDPSATPDQMAAQVKHHLVRAAAWSMSGRFEWIICQTEQGYMDWNHNQQLSAPTFAGAVDAAAVTSRGTRR